MAGVTLKQWCRANWDRLPEMVRKDILDHFEAWFDPKTKTDDIEWLRTYETRPMFHFSTGMQIRNRFRDQWADMELPIVTASHDGLSYGPSQNWDDYYTGGIDEFLERHPKK